MLGNAYLCVLWDITRLIKYVVSANLDASNARKLHVLCAKMVTISLFSLKTRGVLPISCSSTPGLTSNKNVTLIATPVQTAVLAHA